MLSKFTTQAPESHQLFKCPAAFQHLNHSLLLSWPRQPPSETHRPHPSYCYAGPFSLSARKTNGTGEWWSVVCGNWYFGAPKAHEKHLTKEGTDSKNARCCLWDRESLSWKLKHSLAPLADFHQATARLETALDFTYYSFVSLKNLRPIWRSLTQVYPLCSSHGESAERSSTFFDLPHCRPDREVILRCDIIFTHVFSYKDSDINVGCQGQQCI